MYAVDTSPVYALGWRGTILATFFTHASVAPAAAASIAHSPPWTN